MSDRSVPSSSRVYSNDGRTPSYSSRNARFSMVGADDVFGVPVVENTNNNDGNRSSSQAPTNAEVPATTTSSTSPSITQQQQLHSPFLNGILRYSPKNTAGVVTHLSPLNRGRESYTNAGQLRARFFDAASTSKPPAAIANTHLQPDTIDNNTVINTNTTTSSSHSSSSVLLVDGIPLDQLRNLVQNSIGSAPLAAVYYSGVLFAKTKTATDATWLAKAYLATSQYDACLRIVEEAALLLQPFPWDAVLLACKALQAKKDWTILIELLEDMCRTPEHSNYNDNTTSGRNGMNTFHALAASQPLEDDDEIGWLTLKRSIVTNDATIHPLSLVCWYRGLAYQETDSRSRATTYWKLALKLDCLCQSAWEALLSKNLLTPALAHELVTQQLDFSEHQEWLRSLYLARIELTPQEPVNFVAQNDAKTPMAAASGFSMTFQGTSLQDASSILMSSPIPAYSTPAFFSNQNNSSKSMTLDPGTDVGTGKCITIPPKIQQDVDTAFDNLWNKNKLQDAPQVLAIAARRAYRRYDWKNALAYCQELSQLDPAVEEVVYCYVATLVILGHKRFLFRLAHEWVEAAPKSAHAWFAVGAYYYCIQRYHVAQRHFCRATRLDPKCTEAWIAFGCSFAACDESDQALASFRAAQRLSPGDHMSLMYMGMEYVRTNHLVLAQYFLQAALKTSGGDPLCLHELGVLCSQKGDHHDAISWFRRALASAVGGESLQECVALCHDPYWESTIFNLGHSFRKTRQFDHAAICFARCVALAPDNFSTYLALAYTEHLMGDMNAAIAHYHQALGIRPDDPLSTDLLNRVLTDHLVSMPMKLFASISAVDKNVATKDCKNLTFSPRNDSAMSVDSDMSM